MLTIDEYNVVSLEGYTPKANEEGNIMHDSQFTKHKTQNKKHKTQTTQKGNTEKNKK